MSRGSATMSAPGEACSDKVHCQKGGVLSGKGRGWRVSRGWLRGGLVRAPGRAEVAEVFHGGDLPLCQFLSFPLQRFSFRVPLLFSLRSPGHPPSPPPSSPPSPPPPHFLAARFVFSREPLGFGQRNLRGVLISPTGGRLHTEFL